VTTPPVHDDGRLGVLGNERLTALAGAVLLVMIVVEVATVPAVRALIAVHIFVGVVLVGPLAVKLASTGWRFLHYYAQSPPYRRKGPPRPLERALAPMLVIATLVLFGSGLALVATTPGTEGLIHKVHHASALAWIALVGLHLLAYAGRVPGMIAADWRPPRLQPAPGRGRRLGVNVAAVVLGVIGAILVLPAFNPWIQR
jgi:hypothetical protein